MVNIRSKLHRWRKEYPELVNNSLLIKAKIISKKAKSAHFSDYQ